MKTTGVNDIPKFGLLDFLGHPTVQGITVHMYQVKLQLVVQGWVLAEPADLQVQTRKSLYRNKNDNILLIPLFFQL